MSEIEKERRWRWKWKERRRFYVGSTQVTTCCILLAKQLERLVGAGSRKVKLGLARKWNAIEGRREREREREKLASLPAQQQHIRATSDCVCRIQVCAGKLR